MADAASERPCILQTLIALLSVLRHLAALGSLPSYLCLWLSMLLADSAAFKETSAGGHRTAHAVMAVPRLFALMAFVPTGLAGLALGVEVGARWMNLGWPPGLGAVFGCALTLHGVWFLTRHPRLPEKARLRYTPFPRAIADAAFDLCALAAFLLVVVTVFRLPILAKHLLSLPADSGRGKARCLTLENASLVFVDLLCLPVLAMLSVAPWRWQCAIASLQEEGLSPFARRGKLLLNAVDGVVDVPFLVLGICMVLNPWRCVSMSQEMQRSSTISGCRLIAAWHFAMLVADFACLALLPLLLATPWRFVWAVQEIVGKTGHPAVLWQVVLAPVDTIAILSMFLTLPTHRSSLCKSSQVVGKWRESPEVQLQAARAALDLILDVLLCTVPLLCLALSVYRLPHVIAGLRSGSGRAFIWCEFLTLILEIPLIALGAALVVIPWRLKWLLDDLLEAPLKSKSGGSDVACLRRMAVLHHACHAIGDVLSFVALLLLASTGYRLPLVIAGLIAGKGRRLIFWQLGIMILEIPLICLGLTLLVVPWRLAWLIKDVSETKDVTFRRLAIFHHILFALADLLVILALLVLLMTAPHRLCAPCFRSKLQGGMCHIKKSANRTLTYKRPSPRVPEEGSTITAYHGTKPENAALIEAAGFKPSSYGMLGPGVYVSRDPSKAESYGSVILNLNVTIGKTAVIEYQRHPHQTDWSAKGYDVAWVPAGCGMVQSNREEGCVADASKIQVVGRYVRTRHPHLLCLREGLEGLVDLVVCGAAMLVILGTVYRLPSFVRHAYGSPASSNWELRCRCLQQALLVLMDTLTLLASVALLVLSPWRFAMLVADLTCHCQGDFAIAAFINTSGNLLYAAIVDPLCIFAMLVLIVSGYRLPALGGGSQGRQNFRAYFALDSCLPWLILWEGLQVLLDIPFLPLGLTSLCSWRACFFCRRVSAGPCKSTVSSTKLPPVPDAIHTRSKSEIAAEEQIVEVESGDGESKVAVESPLPQWPSAHDSDENAQGRSDFKWPARNSDIDEASIQTSHLPEEASAQSACGPQCEPSQRPQAHIGDGEPSDSEQPVTDSRVSSWGGAHEVDGTINRYRCAAAQSFGLILNDLFTLALMLISLVLLSRVKSLYTRITCMAQTHGNHREYHPKAKCEEELASKQSESREADAGLLDFTDGLRHMKDLDGEADHLSLTFIQLVVLEEFFRSLLMIPVLLLAPLAIFLTPSGTVERYVCRRFELSGHESTTAEEGPGGDGFESAASSQQQKHHSRFPVCFFALPLPALLRLSSQSADDTLWKCEIHAFVTLAMMILLAFHELSTLIYLGLLIPLTMGRAFWSVQCSTSRLGKVLRNCCHVLQALTFPLVLVFLLALFAAPSLHWWQPEQGWLTCGPLKIHGPAQVELPAWGFWTGQAALVLLTLAVTELLARSQKVGYNPVRGFAAIILNLLGLITGHSCLWKFTDVCCGVYVRCCYNHRRTCLCLGEIGLAIGVVPFFTWPMCLPTLLLQENDVLGKRLAWWIVASIVSCVFLFHAVRITKKFWGKVPPATSDGPASSDLEAGVPRSSTSP